MEAKKKGMCANVWGALGNLASIWSSRWTSLNLVFSGVMSAFRPDFIKIIWSSPENAAQAGSRSLSNALT